MPDRTPWSLEDLLSAARREMIFPETPDLSARVLALAGDRVRRPAGRLRRLALPAAAAIAVLVIAAIVGVLAVKDAREAVADFLGLAVEGQEVHLAPTSAPGSTPSPLPSPVAINAEARLTTLAEAERMVGRPLALPIGKAPQAVYTQELAGQSVVILHFPEMDLWEMPLPAGAVLQKFVSGTLIQQLTVSGRPGYWFTGGQRFVRFVDASGREIAGTVRAVERSTLTWADGAYSYRLESALSLEEATAIAETLRQGTASP